LQAVLFTMLAHENLGQTIFPGADRLLDLVLDGLGIDLDAGPVARPDNQMHARQLGLADLDGKIEPLALERPFDDVLDLLPIFGIEAIARNEYQAGVEAAIALAAHEQARLAALLQVENAAG